MQYKYETSDFVLFTEREENVKADIFHAYIALLKQTKPLSSGRENSLEITNLLMQQVPNILKATCKQMKVGLIR